MGTLKLMMQGVHVTKRRLQLMARLDNTLAEAGNFLVRSNTHTINLRGKVRPDLLGISQLLLQIMD